MATAGGNPYVHLLTPVVIEGEKLKYFDLTKLKDARYDKLPFSIRILLESAVRSCDGFHVKKEDIENILDWEKQQHNKVEVPFRPSRVLLQDLTGVAAVVDFAAMRDAFQKLGGDPNRINPLCPADLVIDHSVQVDFSRVNNNQNQPHGKQSTRTPPSLCKDCESSGFCRADSLRKNEDLEFERNKERFEFLKWGSLSLKNTTIVPPGSGICHQVNLEYLARVVFKDDDQDGLLYPDSLVGLDSHTTMINGLGIVGWGVGGIEAEAVMLGQPICMVLPEVIGYRLVGTLPSYSTSTDVVLTITKHLRSLGVVGKFVEFFGPGVAELSIADRATIANMCPEYGATVAFFPPDSTALEYLKQTGREASVIDRSEIYLKAVRLFRQNYQNETEDPCYTQVVELNLSTITSSLSGPKRPQDRVPVAEMKEDFTECLVNQVGFKGFGINSAEVDKSVPFIFDGNEYILRHGSVVIAAITSCTNTSNPSVMLGAGLLAKKAVEAGLRVAPYIKTSMSPGSGVVTHYLQESGVTPYLKELGFDIVGYGCMTCIGNSGPLPGEVVEAIEKGDLVACGVLSGNRNFEGRVHRNTRANYLASPLLVVAYALAGTVRIDFENEPIGLNEAGQKIFLRDVWPSREEILAVQQQCVIPAMFKLVYSKIKTGNDRWNSLVAEPSLLYRFDSKSTYIKQPPYFDGMTEALPEITPIENARVLLYLGDSVTTDHISPAGSISRTSPAAKFLIEQGVSPAQFNSYGSRRGNDAIMTRGTFANIRLVNKFMSRPGPMTVHIPSGQEMPIFDSAELYRKEGTPLIILTGKDYGSGSSRDWAAKGPYLLGVRAIIAESYERIHRSNLIGMGIIPLQFLEEQSAESLGLTGRELYRIDLPKSLTPRARAQVHADSKTFEVIVRFDTEVELEYYRNGGILQYMLRQLNKKFKKN